MELELGWGHHDRPVERRQPLSEGRAEETETLRELLKVCDDYDVPFTFDIVGHLLHERCTGSHDGPHASDWFDTDPGTSVGRDPEFYAPDLVERITDTATDHEIGTHTYSHVLCDETSKEVIDWELARVREVHERVGLPAPTSLVTPRHQRPPLDVLADHGIETLRAPISVESPDSRLATFAWILGRNHPPCFIDRTSTITRTSCTPYPSLTAQHLRAGRSDPHPAFRAIPESIRRWIHRRFLRQAVNNAIERDGHLHLWTHLYNLANEVQRHMVLDFIEWLGNRSEEDVRIVPMNEL